MRRFADSGMIGMELVIHLGDFGVDISLPFLSLALTHHQIGFLGLSSVYLFVDSPMIF